MRYFDVIIIGAGGAGLMCAIHAAQRGRTVCIVEHNYKVGRKILISGGGRCNFTNIYASPENYVSHNPHFCKSALSRYTPGDFIDMVRKHRIAFHEKKLGQLFCDHSAQQIVDMLLDECEDAEVELKLATRVVSIGKHDSGDGFAVTTNHERLECASLVVASGGLSIPPIGATGFGYELAQQFGLKIIATDPALVGFNFTKKDRAKFVDLSGVSLDTNVTCNGTTFRENILFTHTGLSGPAILQSSLYWDKNDVLSINVSPDNRVVETLLQKKHAGVRAELKNVLAEVLPKRFAERWCELYYPSKPIAELAETSLNQVAEMLSEWKIVPVDTFGYQKAEVTRGGVDTDELSSKTMESKKVKGLYFIGEVVDVTGQLGGYNFQWAWASAYACAQAV
jgi:predicted Rossmann fold flavoprotein